mmetsp:Transcript_17669/g.25335  ORF Transcript_17669/g.25335 Transcript_17669/m.25335 type:complete len:205 (+) Transcript_17669:266-880(+)
MCNEVVTVICSLFGWILSAFAAFSCFFIEGKFLDGQFGSSSIGVGFLGISTWRYGSFYSHGSWCKSWESYSLVPEILGVEVRDSTWTAAYAFAVIAFCLGFFAVVFSFCSQKGRGGLAALLFFITLCQGLSLLVFSSDVVKVFAAHGIELGISFGAGCSIAAIIFWFFAAVSAAGVAKNGDGDSDASREELEEPLVANDEAEAA